MAHTAITEEKYFKEVQDAPEVFNAKVGQLVEFIRQSKHFIVFTGAGISTSAGIPDFRGPEGVWTLAAQNRKSTKKSVSTVKAYPTVAHMALVGLQNADVMKYLVSQNCDGLHKRSGIRHDRISELHGNSNIEKCETCGREYLRDYACYRLGHGHDHYTGRHCVAKVSGKVCNGRLLEYTIDFGQNLPAKPLELAFANAKVADLCLVLGSSLTVSPACDVPATVKRRGGRLVICNLQLTQLSESADCHIHAPCDKVMNEVMARLQNAGLPVEIPRWVLRRHVVVQAQPTDKGLRLRVGGLDADDPRLPATIFEGVEIVYDSKKAILTKEPFEVTLPQDNRNAPMEVRLLLDWMGHYDEPSVNLSFVVAPGNHRQSWEWRMGYTASLGTWEITPVQETLKAGEEKVSLFEEQANTFPRFECTLQPCATQGIQGGKPHPACVWPASACLNGLLHIFGGAIDDFQGTADTAKFISVFDPQLNLWVASPRMQPAGPFAGTPIWGHSATTNHAGNAVYLFGGFDSTSQYADLYIFSYSSNHDAAMSDSASAASSSPAPVGNLRLVPLSRPPSPRAGHSATLIPSFGKRGSPHLLVFGGCYCKNGPYIFNNEVHVLDLQDGKEWERLTCTGVMPSARAQHSAVLLGDMLVVSGGCNANWLFNDIYTLNVRTLCWNKVIVDPRVQLDRRVVALPLPSLVALHPQDFRLWPAAHTAAVLWTGPAASTAALFLSGFGASPDFPEKNNSQYLLLIDPAANLAQLTPAPFVGSPFLARTAHCTTVCGSRLLMFGGRNHQQRSTEGGIVVISVATHFD